VADKFRLTVTLALCALAAMPIAQAERADREKPVNLESDSVDIDDGKREGNFIGNVQLTQGTLLIKADKIIVKQDAAGFQYGIAYGKPASFRQKREGTDEYIEGFGERIEYDSKADTVQFFKSAHIKRGGDDVRGEYISYNAITEFFQVIGSGKPDDRVKVVIQPKPKAPGAPAAEGGVPLKPAENLKAEKP
jgi:lipopolysaccharide export system protein LptA